MGIYVSDITSTCGQAMEVHSLFIINEYIPKLPVATHYNVGLLSEDRPA